MQKEVFEFGFYSKIGTDKPGCERFLPDRSFHFKVSLDLELSPGTASPHEVQNQRNYGYDQQHMNEAARDMESQPGHQPYHQKYEEEH